MDENLVKYQSELKDLVTKSSKKALIRLRQIVTNRSLLYDEIIQLTARLNKIERESRLNIINHEHKSVEYDKIRNSVLDVINNIDRNDFVSAQKEVKKHVQNINLENKDYLTFKKEFNKTIDWLKLNLKGFEYSDYSLENVNDEYFGLFMQRTTDKQNSFNLFTYGSIVKLMFNTETWIDCPFWEVKTKKYHEIEFDLKEIEYVNLSSEENSIELEIVTKKNHNPIWSSELVILDKNWHKENGKITYEGEMGELGDECKKFTEREKITLKDLVFGKLIQKKLNILIDLVNGKFY